MQIEAVLSRLCPNLTKHDPHALFPRLQPTFSDESTAMHRYRSHTCGALRESDIGAAVRLSGWVHRVRDHGGVLFIDLRDHYGLTQVVADPDSPAFRDAEKVRSEWVIRVDGKVRARPAGTENPDLPTGLVEVFATEIEVLGRRRRMAAYPLAEGTVWGMTERILSDLLRT